MTEITHRTIDTNGIKMHIAEAGAGPPVLLLHGFPELWYSWRHQLPALAEAGYHAIAPDMRGYGRTDAPQPIEAYNMRNMTADIAGLLDAIGERSAVVVGHDWGSPIAWHCALLYPDRFPGVVAMSVPYLPRAPMPPLQLMRQVFANNFFYIIYFQEPGVAEKELEADVRRSLRLFLYRASGDAPTDVELARSLGLLEGFETPTSPAASTFLEGMVDPEELPGWITEADIDYYAKEFQRTGFRGGLNRYRNMDRDWEKMPELQDKKIEQPALFIIGEKDGVASFAPMDPMKQFVPNLKMITLKDAGHWTQQERPAETNAALIDFLKSL